MTNLELEIVADLKENADVDQLATNPEYVAQQLIEILQDLDFEKMSDVFSKLNISSGMEDPSKFLKMAKESLYEKLKEKA